MYPPASCRMLACTTRHCAHAHTVHARGRVPPCSIILATPFSFKCLMVQSDGVPRFFMGRMNKFMSLCLRGDRQCIAHRKDTKEKEWPTSAKSNLHNSAKGQSSLECSPYLRGLSIEIKHSTTGPRSEVSRYLPEVVLVGFIHCQKLICR